MKNLIFSCLMFVSLSSFLPRKVVAQVANYSFTFMAQESSTVAGHINSFYDPNTWKVTTNCTGTDCFTSTSPPPSQPQYPLGSNSNYPEKIIIDGINVALLDINNYNMIPGSSITIINSGSLTIGGNLTIPDGGVVEVGNNGDLYVSAGGIIKGAGNSLVLVVDSRGGITIDAGGFIIGGNIQLGNGQDNFRATNLTVRGPLVASNAPLARSVQVEQLNVDKATVTVGAGANITTACNLVLKNTVLKIDGSILVKGNLDLFPGGNVADCGSGLLTVRGCVFASAGSINQLTATCSSSSVPPKICIAQTIVSPCPGSVFGVACAAADSRLVNALACRALPVELISFTALPTTRQTVQLRWATASEKNNASFTVEHSANGKAFSSVRTVPGAGNSQVRTDYEIADEHPMPGMSYYRLRQTDIDGTTSYSPVRSVKLGGSVGAMEVYPGHSAQEWVVSTTLPTEVVTNKNAVVQVFDALGRVQKVDCTADDTATGRWTLDLHTLPTGIYIVRLLTASGSYSQRIAK